MFRKPPHPSDYILHKLEGWYLAGLAKDHSMVIVGDLNDTVDTPSRFGLRDWIEALSLRTPLTTRYLPLQEYFTFRQADAGISRIDHVLIPQQFPHDVKAVACGVDSPIDFDFTDHNLIWIGLQFPGRYVPPPKITPLQRPKRLNIDLKKPEQVESYCSSIQLWLAKNPPSHQVDPGCYLAALHRRMVETARDTQAKFNPMFHKRRLQVKKSL